MVVDLGFLLDLQFIYEITHLPLSLCDLGAKSVNFFLEMVRFGIALRHLRIALLHTPLHRDIFTIDFPELRSLAFNLIFKLNDLINLMLVLEEVPHVFNLFRQLVVLLLTFL